MLEKAIRQQGALLGIHRQVLHKTNPTTQAGEAEGSFLTAEGSRDERTSNPSSRDGGRHTITSVTSSRQVPNQYRRFLESPKHELYDRRGRRSRRKKKRNTTKDRLGSPFAQRKKKNDERLLTFWWSVTDSTKSNS